MSIGSQARIAVKPPEYFPRLAYIALMNSVDVFVLADTFQYSRQSFHNRMRIRTPQGWHWVSIPLEGQQHGWPIYQTKIDHRTYWPSKHQRALQFNYSQTPFYAYLVDLLDRFYHRRWETLGAITCQSIYILHEVLQLKCELVLASQLQGRPDSLNAILERMPAQTLVTDYGGDARASQAGISYTSFSYQEPQYRQQFDGFEYDITALDLFCNTGPEAHWVLGTPYDR